MTTVPPVAHITPGPATVLMLPPAPACAMELPAAPLPDCMPFDIDPAVGIVCVADDPAVAGDPPVALEPAAAVFAGVLAIALVLLPPLAAGAADAPAVPMALLGVEVAAPPLIVELPVAPELCDIEAAVLSDMTMSIVSVSSSLLPSALAHAPNQRVDSTAAVGTMAILSVSRREMMRGYVRGLVMMWFLRSAARHPSGRSAECSTRARFRNAKPSPGRELRDVCEC